MGPLRKLGSTLFRWWMAFAHALGYVNTKVLLTVFYVLIMGPARLFCILFRIDFLDRHILRSGSYWKAKESIDQSLERSKHQF